MRKNPGAQLAYSPVPRHAHLWGMAAIGLLLVGIGIWGNAFSQASVLPFTLACIAGGALLGISVTRLFFSGLLTPESIPPTHAADAYAARSPVPTVEINSEGEVLYANDACEAAFVGINSPDTEHRLIRETLKHIDRKSPRLYYLFEYADDERLFEVQIHFVAVSNTFFLYVSDRTDQKAFRHEIQDREEIFRKLVQGTNEALIMTDRDNYIELVNEQFLHLFGYEESEVLHKNAVEILMKEEDPSQVNRRHKDRLAGISDVYEMEQKRKNGEIIWTLVSASPFRDRNGQVVGTIAALTDITALKKVEKMLKERNEQMDLFLYKATHDLKGPLASIQGILSIALEQCEQPTVRQYIDMAVTSSERLDNALVDLIQVTRINKAKFKMEAVEVPKVLEDVMNSIGHMPEREGVQVIPDIRIHTPFRTDKASLTSILQNLVVNAIKYRRPEEQAPFVKIRAFPFEKGLKIEVSDNGEGISPEIQEKIFKMFYRGNKKSKGTGLGLYIVQQIVEKLNGNISLESKVGKGTRFSVYIPQAIEADEEAEPVKKPQATEVSI